jgi:stage II sporulation protein D
MRDAVAGFVALVAVASPILAGPPPVAAAVDGGTVTLTGEVRIEVDDDAVLDIDDARTVHGSLRLDTTGRVVNDVAMEEYVAGVAEMPSRWPRQALKAQAVAARTYAWWSAEHAAHDGADICATTACQVYAGAGVVADDGERWAEAVAATRGEVLVTDEGGPALARYFSTSGGRTYDNEEVFPSTGPRSYLTGIEDPYDAVSPYHRWQVRFTREEFDEVLGAGERLAAVTPVVDVRRVGAVDDHHATVVVTGAGDEVEVTALELRDFVSRVAPGRFADRFPSARADGLRRLPSTLPSSRYAVAVTDDEVVFEGQGWGHGVGMGQYGARGRALDGHDHTEILTAYYRGLRPQVHDGVPERIRVHLDDVGSEFTVRADAPFTRHRRRG